jgi:DNA gyrase/topoisomerase IV subunit A
MVMTSFCYRIFRWRRIEDLIADENVVITISHAGYIKRTNLTEYKRRIEEEFKKVQVQEIKIS